MPEAKVDYLDLDVLIERSGKGYRARILSSPAGEVDAIPFHLPFNRDQLENFVLKMGRPVAMTRGFGRGETRVARDFGERLFGSLFHDQMGTCLRSSLEVARDQSLGLRVRLRLSGSPELANVPWEYFYDPEEQRFLVLSDATPLVRYLELPRRVQLLSVEPPLRILVMISRPKGFQALDVDREWSLIQHALKPLTDAGRVHVERIEEASMAGLQRRLRRGQFHVFHFIGHGGFDQGEATGTLVLEGPDRQPSMVSSEHLSTVLCDHETLRLVLLNACEGARTDERSPFAGVAHRLVQQGVPAVVAMQFAITDEAAIAFTETFYETVADSYPVDTAVTQGRKAILNVTSDAEWGTPVLYMRSRDGRLFEVAGSPALTAGALKPDVAPTMVDTETAKEPAASTRHVDAGATDAVAPDVPVVVVEPEVEPAVEKEPVAPNGARERWEPVPSPPEPAQPHFWESIENPLSAGLVGGLVAAAAVVLLLTPLTVTSRNDFNPYAIVLLAAAAVALGGSVLMIRGMRAGRAIVLGCLAVILIVTVGVVAFGSPLAPAASPSLAAAGRFAVGLGSLILVLLVAFSRFPGFASGGPGAPTRSLALALAFTVIAPAPSVFSFLTHSPTVVDGTRHTPTPTPPPPRPVVAGTWSRVGDMSSPRFSHSATLLGDGAVLVAGGMTLQNQNRGLSSAELYDPGTKQWHAAPNMLVGRQGHIAVALPNGKVLVVGGTDGNGQPTNSAEIYDTSKVSWSAAQPMPGSWNGGHAFPLAQGKQVLFISESSGSAQIYDSETGRWKRAASFERREENGRAQLTDGRVMIVGGYLAGADNSPTPKAEIYDPASDAWRPAAGPNLPRAFAPTIALRDGRVVLMGGYTGKHGSFDGVTAAMEIYSPSNNTWSNVASVPGPVLTCYCRMILDGNAISAPRATERALSGDDSAQSTKSYLYDVRADRWIVDNPLTVSLASGGNATVLSDGHVLVTGGAVDLHRASPVAELYTPG
jgi:CHAT domain-containing protein